VSGLRIGAQSRMAKCHFPSGFWPKEPRRGKEPEARWTNGKGLLRVPFAEDEQNASCRIRVSAETTKSLVVRVGSQETRFEVSNIPEWIEFPLCAKPFDMINNVGSDLVGSKNSADRGIFQPDLGQFDQPERVFAWCGCSVLLNPRYLDDVGLLDERFFLYYEDFDLSWRGQRRGWSYAYVPTSVVRHLHASTTGEYSDLFNFYVWRNRLLVLLKNAPTSIALKETGAFLEHVYRHVVNDLRNGQMSPFTGTLLEVLRSFTVHAPFAFGDRLRIGLRNRISPLQHQGRPACR
jgi:hypothetical protein